MKKMWIKTLGVLSCCFLLVGCSTKTELPANIELTEEKFDTQSTIRTRVQQELANNKSYQGINYLANYSLGAKVEPLIQAIASQYEKIAPYVSAPVERLIFQPIQSDVIISEGSSNHYYLVNERIVVNFIVPKSETVKWDGTVSNIQLYYSVNDPMAMVLKDFISKAIIQEIESPETALTLWVDEKAYPLRNYQFSGGLYETQGKLITLTKKSQEFIFKALNLKPQDYLYCFNFHRTGF